jgi:effector-associated domain 7 (EAD7)-containing protein
MVSIVAFAVASYLTAIATETLFGGKQGYLTTLAVIISIGFAWIWLWHSFGKHREIHTLREASPEATPEHSVRSRSAGEGIGVEQSTHISQEGTAFDPIDVSLPALHRKISETFSESELGTLCKDVGVDYDDLEGFGRAAKTKDLVFYLERRGRVPDLLTRVQKERPRVDWQRFVRQQP